MESTFERIVDLLSASFSPEIPTPMAETLVSQAFQQIMQKGHIWSFLRQEGYWILGKAVTVECTLTQYNGKVEFTSPFSESDAFDDPHRFNFLPDYQLWDGERWYEIYKFDPSSGLTLVGNYLGATKTVTCTLAMPVVSSPINDAGMKLPKIREIISAGDGNTRLSLTTNKRLKVSDPKLAHFGTPCYFAPFASANYTQVLKSATSNAMRLGETRFRIWPCWNGAEDLIIPVEYIAANWKFGGLSGIVVNDGATADNAGGEDLLELAPEFDPAYNQLDTLPLVISEDLILSQARVLGAQYCAARVGVVAAYKGINWNTLIATYLTQAEQAYEACRREDRALWAIDSMHAKF